MVSGGLKKINMEIVIKILADLPFLRHDGGRIIALLTLTSVFTKRNLAFLRNQMKEWEE